MLLQNTAEQRYCLDLPVMQYAESDHYSAVYMEKQMNIREMLYRFQTTTVIDASFNQATVL